jgi:hypothetical protein
MVSEWKELLDLELYLACYAYVNTFRSFHLGLLDLAEKILLTSRLEGKGLAAGIW